MGNKLSVRNMIALAALGAICLGGLTKETLADTAAMVKEKCAGCHGLEGHSKYAKVPNIAGFSAETIKVMLEEYKSKDRIGDKFKPEGGEETDMNAVTKDMSKDDIIAYAKYFAAQKFMPNKGQFDAALAKRGAKLHDMKCEKCHSDGATNPEDDASLLAGQTREYLTRAFEKMKAGDQPMPRKMKKKFKKLKDGDFQKLIEYYVSGGGAAGK
jgi:sulfide dehydrogenase cytochrome subunit